MKDIPITVVVPVKNEEANLAKCLSRLERFSEVIVVDSSSTDRTPDIVREFGAKYLNFEWNGRYPKKRNWLLLNHKLANDWVLFLDADEFVDADFCDAAADAVQSGNYAGFWLNYTNYFLGRRLKYGVPQRKLAMFRVGAGLYERIEEVAWSRLDMEIHEHPVIDGPLGEISQPIEHNDDRGITKFLDRHREYALWEAQRYRMLMGGNTLAEKGLTLRQRRKYRNLGKWWFPWFYGVYTYFIRLGILDGGSGLYYAFYKVWYFNTIRILILEGVKQTNPARTTAQPDAEQIRSPSPDHEANEIKF